ncbi:MAG: hypothetical protein IKG04_03500 [Exiguobacterium sp.]|nr:hypothetical protein [Exiguobacterium sp.]
MKLEITGENIQVEEKPSLRAAFEDMTRKLMEQATQAGIGGIDPGMAREIRENVRALGGFL